MVARDLFAWAEACEPEPVSWYFGWSADTCACGRPYDTFLASHPWDAPWLRSGLPTGW